MSEHPSLERISELLEAGSGPAPVERHLEGCPRCRAEVERMRRTRMALSGLGDLETPPGEWERIESRLRERGRMRESGPAVGAGASAGRELSGSGWVPQVAAAALVFAVGLAAGLQLSDTSPAADTTGFAAAASGGGMEAMLGAETDDLEPLEDPVRAAEESARLDALTAAAREALQERPEDPALNSLLFRLTERRRDLESRLGAAARLASLEYR